MIVTLLATLMTVSPGPERTPTFDHRWGFTPHRAIATVAAGRLSDRASRMVERLLGDTTLAMASTWADEIRSERPQFGPWHYVNISILDSLYIPEKHCPEGCIISAAEEQVAILANRNRTMAERSEALKWVVHLIEDLHMPLHSGDRGDRGGNDVALSFQGKRTNFHALWDYGMLEGAGLDEDRLVARITSRLGRRTDLTEMATGSIRDWVIEAHDISRDVVYPSLPSSLELDVGYFAGEVEAVADLQLVRASVRLAAILERALGG